MVRRAFLSGGTYPKIARILENSSLDVRTALSSITGTAILIEVLDQTVDALLSDEPDNRVLECTLACGADYIVSGDHTISWILKNFKRFPF